MAFIGRDYKGIIKPVDIDQLLLGFQPASKIVMNADLHNVFPFSLFKQSDNTHTGNTEHISYFFLRFLLYVIIPCNTYDKLFFPIIRHCIFFSQTNKISHYEHIITLDLKKQDLTNRLLGLNIRFLHKLIDKTLKQQEISISLKFCYFIKYTFDKSFFSSYT